MRNIFLSLFFYVFTVFSQHEFFPLNVSPLQTQVSLHIQTQFEIQDHPFIKGYLKDDIEVKIERLDSLALVVISRTIKGVSIELPRVLSTEGYYKQIVQFHWNKNLAAKARERIEKEDISTGIGGFEIGTDLKNKALERLFGSSRVAIHINGNIGIDLSGRKEERSGEQSSQAQKDQASFSPKMDLRQQFFLEGKIGEKLSISANQDSETQNDLENVIKVKYTGDEDEIIQSIEAGNIDLSLPGTKFVTHSGSNKGLFGVKSKLQFGDFNLTAIASVEKGKKEKLSFKNGKSEKSSDFVQPDLKDYDYVKYRFFFVDKLFRDHFEKYKNYPLKETNESIGLVQNLKVYVQEFSSANNIDSRRTATAVQSKDVAKNTNWASINTNSKNGAYETTEFTELSPTDYTLDQARGFFYLKNAYRGKAIAITYDVQVIDPAVSSYFTEEQLYWMSSDDFLANDSKDKYLEYRNTSQNNGRFLKLIKSAQMNDSQTKLSGFETLEELHMKNVYPFGYAVNDPDLKVTIYKGSVDQFSDKSYTYLNIFGLDLLNQNLEFKNKGDQIFDKENQLLTFDGANYLVFPMLQPFKPTEFAKTNIFTKIGYSWSQETENDIYLYSKKPATETFSIKIDGKYIGGAESGGGEGFTYSLGFGVLEGSERVVITGKEMVRGIDYDINYFTGQLTLLSAFAILNKDNMDIEYETQNFFQLDKKVLLGGRLEYRINKDAFFGATALFLNKSSLDDKVRIGQEPFRNFVWDINGSYKTDSKFLTRMINKVPGIDSQKESEIRVEAEFAQVIPNPNTKSNSRIGDNNGVAYIDDFEGSKRKNGLSMSRLAWNPASSPLLKRNNRLFSRNEADSTRAQLAFFNPFQQISAKEIFDRDLNAKTGNDRITVLNVAIKKETKLYNDDGSEWPSNESEKNTAIEKGIIKKTPQKNTWAGIMASNKANNDLTNVEFLEVWARWDYPKVNNVRPKLNIDFGVINEDYYTGTQIKQEVAEGVSKGKVEVVGSEEMGRDRESTEDFNYNDKILNENEDVGLDRMDDAKEKEFYGMINPLDNWKNLSDNARNNFFSTISEDIVSKVPWQINGTEGNSKESGIAQAPDTEDMGYDGFTVSNNYYHTEIPMYHSTELEQLENNPEETYFSAYGNTRSANWVKFRIPVRDIKWRSDSGERGEAPSLSQINHFRIYVDNFDELGNDDPILLNIAEISFVGTDWQAIPAKAYDDLQFTNQEIGQKNETVSVNFLNTEDNGQLANVNVNNHANYYISPEGVQGDYIDNERTTRGKEQSMILEINNLEAGKRVEVYKSSQFVSNKVSLHNYKKIKMFMRAHKLNDELNRDMPETTEEFLSGQKQRSYFYIKFGRDPKNFYEYRVPIIVNYDDGLTNKSKDDSFIQQKYWDSTKVEIDIDKLLQTKVQGTRMQGPLGGFYYEEKRDLERYTVIGTPDITDVKYFILGVYNADSEIYKNRPLNTHIWVNELRATDVRQEAGIAARVSGSVSFADVLDISATFLNKEANFHNINETASNPKSLNTSESQVYTVALNVDKFFPQSWGLSMPVSFNYNNNASIPKFITGSDVPSNYEANGFGEKIKHLFGYSDYSDDIKELSNLTTSKQFNIRFKKNRTNDKWYNHLFLDRFSYDGKYAFTDQSTYIYDIQDNETVNHNFAYKFDFSQDNFVEPLSWLGDGSFIDWFSKTKLYYTPKSIGSSFNVNYLERSIKRRDQENEEDPNITAKSVRQVTTNYKVTDNLDANVTRQHSSDLLQANNGEGMNLYDLFENIVKDPAKKDAFGNDETITNVFDVNYRPNFYSGLTTTFGYKSNFSYKENLLNKNATLTNGRNYTANVNLKVDQIYASMFTGSKSSGDSGGRGGRGGRGRGGKTDSGTDTKKVDLKKLNPLIYLDEFMKSWNTLEFKYSQSNNHATGNHLQELPDWKYQFGFIDDVDVNHIDELLSETRNISNTYDIGNKFKFSNFITLKLDNEYKDSKGTKSSQPATLSKEASFFSLGNDTSLYSDFKLFDTGGGSINSGAYVPDWNLEIRGLEDLPLIKEIAKSVNVSHARKGNAKRSFRENRKDTTLTIESYTFDVSQSYSPLFRVDFQFKGGFTSNFSISQTRDMSFRTETAGTLKETEKYDFLIKYKMTGGFKLPNFWPFNAYFVKNDIDFSLRVNDTKNTTFNYKRDVAEGADPLTKGSWSKTLLLEPSIQYQFSNSVRGSLFYKYQINGSNVIKEIISNEFGFRINLSINS